MNQREPIAPNQNEKPPSFKTIVASTFDTFPVPSDNFEKGEPKRTTLEGVMPSSISNNYIDLNETQYQFQYAGEPVKFYGLYRFKGVSMAVIEVVGAHAGAFRDDLTRLSNIDSVKSFTQVGSKVYLDPSNIDDLTLSFGSSTSSDPSIASLLSSVLLLNIDLSLKTLYLAPLADVSFMSHGKQSSYVKKRPRHTPILPGRRLMAGGDSMPLAIRNLISKTIMPIMNNIVLAGDKGYLPELASLMFNQRWALFMDYVSESSTVTMLSDYSPFGFTPLVVPYDQRIDPNDALSARTMDRAQGRSALSTVVAMNGLTPPHVNLFASTDDEEPTRSTWMYEPETLHRTINLDPACLLALALLGVAPSQPPDISGSLPMNLDAKAFNHDVMIMRTAARLFTDSYNPVAFMNQLTFDSMQPSYKIEKFKSILTNMRSMFPSVSPLSKAVEQSLEQYELRQNHFWKGSPFVDSVYPARFLRTTDFRGSYQVPCLRHRPIMPMCSSNSYNNGELGYEDTMFHQIMETSMPYHNHKLSYIDKATLLVNNPLTRTDQSYGLTRVGGPRVPRPIGVPYISSVYFGSPAVENRWYYLSPVVNELFERDTVVYDMYTSMTGRTLMPDGLPLPGIAPYRDHKAVFSDFMARQRAATRLTLPKVIIRNPHGYVINYGSTSNLSESTVTVDMPDPVEDTFPMLTVKALITPPEAYVGKIHQIQDATGVPDGMMPILDKSQGPFISRLAVRNFEWPGNCDFTLDGAMTENVVSDTPIGADQQSCEYNTEMIGVIPSRREPLVLVDPTPMLVLVKDKLAGWFRP